MSKEQELLAKIKELETELKQVKKQKRYGLVWEDKPEDVVERCKNELPVLTEDSSKRIVEQGGDLTHILIEGDNYHALSVLAYTHKNSIDFIYIDPPYNTGSTDWKYNNAYVDANDTFRHSKWLNMMEKRLRVAKELLKKDGTICVTIDDYELPRLWLCIEEIFGESNLLGVISIRNNPKGRMTQRKFSLIHEYAIFFGKSEESSIKKLSVSPEDKTHNYKQDTDASWYLDVNLRKQGADSTAITKSGKVSDRYYPIYIDSKSGKVSTVEKLEIEIYPIDSKGEKRIWRRSKDVIDEMYKSGDIWTKKQKNDYQLYFKFRGGLDGEMPKTIWYDSEFSASEHGTQLLDKILGERELFQYPKSPFAVIKSIRSATTNKNAIILDFFAGSGTTGHAVLELNKEDGGSRQFILCTNNENKIAEEVTYPRIRNVINGYADVEGIPANLRYYRTDFIGVDKSIDDLRNKFMGRCTEMLQIRENTFFQFPVSKNESKAGWEGENEYFRVFQNTEKLLVAMYHPYEIETFKKWYQFLSEKETMLQKANIQTHKEIAIYIFSMGGEIFEEELAHISDRIRIETIPDEVLETYKKLFGF